MTQEVGLKAGWETAITAMEKSTGGPFGVAIMRGNEVISTGCNLVVPRRDPTAHAAIIAIQRACAGLHTPRLSECELYATCEPCPMCLAAAYWARLRRVYYAVDHHVAAIIGFDDGFISAELAKPNFNRRLRMRQCGSLRALQVEKMMRDWRGQMY